MWNRSRQRILTAESIDDVFHKQYQSIKSTIDNESESQILNVNETEYTQYLESVYKLDLPCIDFDGVTVDSYEAMIPAEYFDISYSVEPGKSYKKEIIQYIIPCSGNYSLLQYRPASIYSARSDNFTLSGNNIVTEILNLKGDAKEIRATFDRERKSVEFNYNALLGDINRFNSTLLKAITDYFKKKKNEILGKKNLLAELGVPIRKKTGTPTTFAVPKPQLREKIIVKPVATNEPFNPEPTLDNKSYQTILKLINDVGKNFERMPSTYKDKKEEDLRDHILMILDPNFEYGSASGETFNKSGKTDILLRYDSTVVFVAECKFWSGEKSYFDAIDQLLGYLTWRETKTSLIIFVKQVDFTSVLSKVKEVTKDHSNYLGELTKSDENWFNFRFHLNGDKNREAKVAVQLYHLTPK